MMLIAFSVYDNAVKAYMQPFFCRARGEALRSFSEACNDQKHQFSKYAADYTLFAVGSFDDASGVFSSGVPERVISAQECIVDDTLFSPDKEEAPVMLGNGRTRQRM